MCQCLIVPRNFSLLPTYLRYADVAVSFSPLSVWRFSEIDINKTAEVSACVSRAPRSPRTCCLLPIAVLLVIYDKRRSQTFHATFWLLSQQQQWRKQDGYKKISTWFWKALYFLHQKYVHLIFICSRGSNVAHVCWDFHNCGIHVSHRCVTKGTRITFMLE